MKNQSLLQQHKKMATTEYDHEGFTLVEVLITMGISLIVMAAAFSLFASYSRSNTVQTISADLQQDIRAGISFLEQDIRSAGLNPRELGSGVGFTAASQTGFTFVSDSDFNGLVPGIDDSGTLVSPEEQITYSFSGGELRRTNLSGTQTLLSNVDSVTFTYLGSTNNTITGNPIPLASLENIRSVAIDITLKEGAGQYGEITRRIQTRIYCRNTNL